MERVCRKIGVGLMVFLGVWLWEKTAFSLVFGWGDEEKREPAGLLFNQTGDQKEGQKDDENDAADHIEKTAFKDRQYFKETERRQKGTQEISLIASELGFFPKTIFVSRDVPVRLYVTGASKSSLCIMMDFFKVRKQVRSQQIEEITFTPHHPGQFRFYCPINGMEGTLVVRELSTLRSSEDVGSRD